MRPDGLAAERVGIARTSLAPVCLSSDTFTPHGSDAKCGHVCHSAVAAKNAFSRRTRSGERQQDYHHDRRLLRCLRHHNVDLVVATASTGQ
jgi:hypothetical protein